MRSCLAYENVVVSFETCGKCNSIDFSLSRRATYLIGTSRLPFDVVAFLQNDIPNLVHVSFDLCRRVEGAAHLYAPRVFFPPLGT